MTDDIEEVWKPLPSNPIYEVSNKGNMRRLLRGTTTPAGYKAFHARGASGKGNLVLAHRLVWQAFCGPTPSHMHINHKNGIKSDNRLENLELVTPLVNIRHAIETGLSNPAHTNRINRKASGTANGSKTMPHKFGRKGEPVAKLSPSDIPTIRRRLLTEGGPAIARDYGVSPSAISDIKTGKTWRNVR